MKKDFENLPKHVQTAMVMAMHVRNELEDFHVKHLTDNQMAELNPIIRQAILEVLEMVLVLSNEDEYNADDVADIRATLNWLVMAIPNYWEIPIENKLINELRIHRKDRLHGK